MEPVSVLNVYNFTNCEAEYMRTGDKCLGLEHCFRLIWKIFGGGEEDDSKMNGFLR